MSANWKTVRLFISSTFRDMHVERDHLVRFVFPELKERCRKQRVHLIDVDLRWGVSESDAENGKALDICLDEIDSCRPYFLGLLGHRYGWVPEGQGRSITEQEIYHGALHNEIPEQIVNLGQIVDGRLEDKALAQEQIDCLARCYLWSPDKNKYLLKDDASRADREIIRSIFRSYSAYRRDRSFFFLRSESFTRELAGQNSDDFVETDEGYREKLAALKQEIIDAGLPWFEYDDLETFGQQVLDRLWSRIETELGQPSGAERDCLDEEAVLHELFMADRTRRFVGRQALLDRMEAFCEGNAESSSLVVTGEPGVGKSALMAKFCDNTVHRHPEWLVIPHFVGASPSSTNLRQMLKRFCALLNALTARLEDLPEDTEELVNVFPNLLAKASEGRTIIIIVDAVNQLERTNNGCDMRWLPERLPENVTVVISTVAGEILDALRARKCKPRVEQVSGLSETEIRTLTKEYLQEIRHEFPNRRVEQTFLNKVASGNPLFIVVALEELRVFGQIDQLAKRVDLLPDSVPALFDQVLDRIESDFSPALVRDCMRYIACGKYGMTAEELQVLLRGYAPRMEPPGEPERLPDMLWARLFRSFRAYLFERSGVIDFYHGQFKEGVERRYLLDEAERKTTHKSISNYFEMRWTEPYKRALDELPHQLGKAGDWMRAGQLLLDYHFIEAKVHARMMYGLLRDYRAICECSTWDYDELLDLRLLHEALQLSTQGVGFYGPQQLISQLYGRLTDDRPKLRGVLETGSNRQTHPWLRPISRSLNEAGGPLLRTIRDLTAVNVVAVTPDSSRIISGSDDGTLKIWDLETGTELRALRGHTGPINAIAITPDGLRVMSGSDDRTLKLWNVDTGQEITTLAGQINQVNTLAISPSGLVAVSASGDSRGNRYELKDRSIKVWDLARGKELHTFQGHTSAVRALAVTPDGLHVVSGADDDDLKVWALQTGKEFVTLKGHSGWLQAIALTPDGRYVIAAFQDRSIKLWDLSAGKECRTLRETGGLVTAMAVTHDGREVVIGGMGALVTIEMCDIESGAVVGRLEGHGEWVNSIAVTPDNRKIISASTDRSIKVWEAERGKGSLKYYGHSRGVVSVVITSDDRFGVSSSLDGTLKVWNIETGVTERTIPGVSGTNAVLVPGTRRIVTSYQVDSLDDTEEVKVVDMGSGDVCLALEGHSAEIQRIAVTSDGRWVMALCKSMVKVWDLNTGDQVKSLTYEVTCPTLPMPLIATYDSKYVIAQFDDRFLRVWDIETGSGVHTLEGPGIGSRWAMAVTADSSQLIAAAREPNALNVWSLETGSVLHTLRGHSDDVVAVTATPNGKLAVSGGLDNSVRVWDLESGRQMYYMKTHAPVTTVSVSQDGRYVVAGLDFRGIQIWDLVDRKFIASLDVDGSTRCAAMTSDGNSVLVGSSNRVHILRLEGMRLAER